MTTVPGKDYRHCWDIRDLDYGIHVATCTLMVRRCLYPIIKYLCGSNRPNKNKTKQNISGYMDQS